MAKNRVVSFSFKLPSGAELPINADVIEHRDPYGTGDSPTQYEVDAQSWKDIPQRFLSQVIDKAIQVYKEG